MSDETILYLSQVVPTILFIVLFFAAAAYAVWPSNRAYFDRAARLPLETDDGNTDNGGEP
jgi:cytochrome c oxidase cbb3-type subunit IV